jgi:predicted O-linked N-acetylglucosamine transferase (SPINDLY family)
MQTLTSSAILAPTVQTSSDEDLMFSSINLEQTVNYYETLIDRGDEHSYNYWYLGLAYLLQSREVDAQATWFTPFCEASELEVSALNHELSGVLDRVSSQELTANNLDRAWLISQYLREIDLTHTNNLFRSILLAIKLNLFTPKILEEWTAIEILSDASLVEVDPGILSQVLELLLNFHSAYVCQFIQECLLSFPSQQSLLIKTLSTAALILGHRLGPNSFITEVLEKFREIEPRNTHILEVLCHLYSNLGLHEQATNLSLIIYDFCEILPDKILANHIIIRTLLTSGNWQKIDPIIHRHRELIELFVDKPINYLELPTNQGIMGSYTFSPYTVDLPESYRRIQNQISKIYLECNQAHIKNYPAEPAKLQKQVGVIRIGYLASTLRSHSVGWLSRWLWQYHDRTKFQIFTYCINQNPDDPVYQKWFRDRSDISYCLVPDGERVAAQIRADSIDILIDLDSLTLDTTCRVLAAKPAPIQVSWLGWDATGLPTVDYFIADRYVLPENAQDYYQERIWRLPQSYLAVDGFEIGISTIRREDLDIPHDAIIYWSGQRGYKRHPQTIRLQMEILKSVPNSYLLIKGESDRHTIEELFGTIANEIGVDLDRLRFLNTVADEATHRANLAIADIVLDTFPYNGATTTLETLWMGIPMVTQVGEQFAARNSYTFMLNAGITEGIAWNQREYVEWGVKLGLDRELRSTIREKLRSGRANAPVWNAKQFTLEMEQAYCQMWAKYQEQQSKSEVIEKHSNN